jgi:hypothetical protein
MVREWVRQIQGPPINKPATPTVDDAIVQVRPLLDTGTAGQALVPPGPVRLAVNSFVLPTGQGILSDTQVLSVLVHVTPEISVPVGAAAPLPSISATHADMAPVLPLIA